MVAGDDPSAWSRVAKLIDRLSDVSLEDPTETGRGAIDLFYREAGVRRPADIALAGRRLQQILLVLAYLHSHPHSVLLINEPDPHLEILRQRQAYVLLRDEGARSGSQVVLVTHSQVILGEALDCNLTLLLDGRTDELASRTEIVTALRHYGAEHYLRARQREYVLYVEGEPIWLCCKRLQRDSVIPPPMFGTSAPTSTMCKTTTRGPTRTQSWSELKGVSA